MIQHEKIIALRSSNFENTSIVLVSKPKMNIGMKNPPLHQNLPHI